MGQQLLLLSGRLADVDHTPPFRAFQKRRPRSDVLPERALGDLGKQALELILAHDAMRAQHRQNTAVELGERDAAARMGARTTRPHDTSTVGRGTGWGRRGHEEIATRVRSAEAEDRDREGSRRSLATERHGDEGIERVGRASRPRISRYVPEISGTAVADRKRANGKPTTPTTAPEAGHHAGLGLTAGHRGTGRCSSNSRGSQVHATRCRAAVGGNKKRPLAAHEPKARG